MINAWLSICDVGERLEKPPPVSIWKMFSDLGWLTAFGLLTLSKAHAGGEGVAITVAEGEGS